VIEIMLLEKRSHHLAGRLRLGVFDGKKLPVAPRAGRRGS